MKSTKNWIGYGIYLLFLIVYFSGILQMVMRLYSQQMKTYNPLPYILWNTVAFILLGVILGVDYIFKEIKKEGTWKINWSKIILIGLPSAYLVACLLALWFNINIIVPPFIYNLLKTNISVSEAIDVLLGYTIISSFYKVKTDNHIST